ncbi:MAG: 2Fe-2S iron-sulfur cluster-binding protein [Bacteroidetes bacterium]|nr:2Fe-2S iron-sulfur cluster-binding protein [Bacteroidota bacterium]MCL5025306.1 2Fe-2S iron-sulfur cluster-binding protein [Chloroflexota bacterium]
MKSVTVWVDGNTSVEVIEPKDSRAVHLTVDGKLIRTTPGKSLLEAVWNRPGIGNIPALCYHPIVQSYGACRLCTVEVEEQGRTRFVASCLYPAKEGLVVRTDTDRVRQLRKGVLELLLARCPEVKVIQDLAIEYGIEKPRFALGVQDCILCGLCVRTCRENIGRSAISLVNRGIFREVAAPFYAYELGDGCVGCGDCVYVCPTGALKLGPDGKPVLPKVHIPRPAAEGLLR